MAQMNAQECADILRGVSSDVDFGELAGAAGGIMTEMGVDGEAQARLLEALHASIASEKGGRASFVIFLKQLLKK